MGMTETSGQLGAVAEDLSTISAQLGRSGPISLPHLSGGLGPAMDGAWAAQLEQTVRLGDELRELAASVRLAAQRYREADQGF